jgi:hypothetical protein
MATYGVVGGEFVAELEDSSLQRLHGLVEYGFALGAKTASEFKTDRRHDRRL